MDEIKKTCHNCKNRDCSLFEKPCSTCIDKAIKCHEFKTMWEPMPKEEEELDIIKTKMLRVITNSTYGIEPNMPINKKIQDLDAKLDRLEIMLKDIQESIKNLEHSCDQNEANIRNLNIDFELADARIESKIEYLDTKLNLISSKIDIKQDEPKFKLNHLVKYKTGKVSYVVIDVKKIEEIGYCYSLERRFSNSKRNYIIAGVLESRLEEV